MAKCLVARITLNLITARDLSILCLVLEGDSIEVTSLLRNLFEVVPWSISTLIQDCLSIIKAFTSFNCNHVEDHIAKHSLFLSECWSSSPPLWLKNVLNFDLTAFG